MDYVVKDSAASIVLCHESMQSVAAPIAKANNATLRVLPPSSPDAALSDRFDVQPDRSAMVIYTRYYDALTALGYKTRITRGR